MTSQIAAQRPLVKQQPIMQPSPMGHNKPPLDEATVQDFMDDARNQDGVDLIARLDEIASRENTLGECKTQADVGRYGDFVRMARVAVKALEDLRMQHNQPILAAQRALKGRADGLIERVAEAERRARNAVDAFMAEERRRQDEQRRAADAAARAASAEMERRAAEQAEQGMDMEVAPVVKIEAAPVRSAAVVSDLGVHIGSSTQYAFIIKSVRQLPDSILTHSKVVEAIEKVIGQQVRGGVREMKGVDIYPVHRTTIRG